MVAMSRWMSAGVRGQPAARSDSYLSMKTGAMTPMGVRPFVEELVQDAGVGVLGDKAGAEEFEAFGCDFPDDAGVV